MIDIFHLQITKPLDQKTWETLCERISQERRERVISFHYEVTKMLSLFAELIVRILANEVLSVLNDKIVFSKSKHGKPQLQDYPNFQFDISHAGKVVVVAISSEEIGVDI